MTVFAAQANAFGDIFVCSGHSAARVFPIPEPPERPHLHFGRSGAASIGKRLLMLAETIIRAPKREEEITTQMVNLCTLQVETLRLCQWLRPVTPARPATRR